MSAKKKRPLNQSLTSVPPKTESAPGSANASVEPLVESKSTEEAVEQGASQLDSQYRDKVIDLATRLVSAQISASTHPQTSNSISAEISAVKSRLPLDHSSFDRLFDGAMARAQQLLRSPILDPRIIHAEQVFSANECISEFQIGERFKKWNWPILRNRKNFHAFMVKVERWFVDHVHEIAPDFDEHFLADSELITELLRIGRERTNGDLLKKILDVVEDHRPPFITTETYRGSFENVTDAAWRRSLIWVIFDNRMPERRASAKLTRSYRPWGLFRYLRHWGAEDEVGLDLVSMLSVARSELDPNLYQHSLDSGDKHKYDFGSLGAMADSHRDSLFRPRENHE